MISSGMPVVLHRLPRPITRNRPCTLSPRSSQLFDPIPPILPQPAIIGQRASRKDTAFGEEVRKGEMGSYEEND